MTRAEYVSALPAHSTRPGAVPIWSTFSGQFGAQAVSGPPPAITGEKSAHGKKKAATPTASAAISQRAAAGSRRPIGNARKR